MNNTTQTEPTTEALYAGTREAIIIYILSKNDSDCETMERYDRWNLICYCNYMQRQIEFEQKYMLFEQWIGADPDDIKIYERENN